MRPAAPVHPAAAPEVEEVLGDVVHAAPLGTLRTHTHNGLYEQTRVSTNTRQKDILTRRDEVENGVEAGALRGRLLLTAPTQLPPPPPAEQLIILVGEIVANLCVETKHQRSPSIKSQSLLR